MTMPIVDLTGTEGRIIDAALALATERPWRDVALRDIAERAGVSLTQMRENFHSKPDVLGGFTRAVDDAVLAVASTDNSDDPKRDALFEVLMARFDALQPYKAALRSIASDPSSDPGFMRALIASQAWMLEAAGIDASGVNGGMRVAGLAAVYGSVYRTWLNDDDPGQARTMAVLDRRLRRGERILSTLDEAAGTLNRIGGRVASIFSRATSAKPQTTNGAAGSPPYDGNEGKDDHEGSGNAPGVSSPPFV